MRFKTIILAFLMAILPVHFCFSQDSIASSLPKFKQDKRFQTGKLANGLNYYFASNPTKTGLIDISLIQKMDPEIPEERLDSIAAGNFFEVQSLGSSLRNFLTRNGIAPTHNGYFSTTKGSICYKFFDISSALPESVMDSTVMAIFDLAKIHAEHGEPTEAQAIVICGDFDQKVMLAKMRLLSMITPHVDGTPSELGYTYDPSEESSLTTVVNGSFATVSAIWREPRTPDEYMQTVLPVISDKLAGELGWIIQKRAKDAFKDAKLNVWPEFRHISSSRSPYDDQIRFSVECMAKDTSEVKGILIRELSRLATLGISSTEYSYARDIYKNNWIKSARRQIVSNHMLSEKCVSAFLYGASLAGEEEKISFAYRDMPLEQQTELFNDYMRNLLSQTVGDNAVLDSLPDLTGWEEIEKTLTNYKPTYTVKAPKDKTEPITGGIIWTFPNGVNVIHKHMDTKGITYFAYAVKGGRQWVDDEKLLSVAGINDDDLINYLASQGIDIKLTLTASDIRIEGSAINENTELLMNYLCAISSQLVNKESMGPNTYKLLALASDQSDLDISVIAGKYVTGLRRGSRWLAGKKIDEDNTDIIELRDFITYESRFKFDRTGSNKAISDIAAYALHDALVSEFHDVPIFVRNWSSYPGVPTGYYRLFIGIHRYPNHGGSAYIRNVTDSEIESRLAKVIERLADTAITKDQLATYKGMARNRHKSESCTAEYFVNMALDRYLDNKNFASRYPILVNSVTQQQIMDFYASAINSNR